MDVSQSMTRPNSPCTDFFYLLRTEILECQISSLCLFFVFCINRLIEHGNLPLWRYFFLFQLVAFPGNFSTSVYPPVPSGGTLLSTHSLTSSVSSAVTPVDPLREDPSPLSLTLPRFRPRTDCITSTSSGRWHLPRSSPTADFPTTPSFVVVHLPEHLVPCLQPEIRLTLPLGNLSKFSSLLPNHESSLPYYPIQWDDTTLHWTFPFLSRSLWPNPPGWVLGPLSTTNKPPGSVLGPLSTTNKHTPATRETPTEDVKKIHKVGKKNTREKWKNVLRDPGRT